MITAIPLQDRIIVALDVQRLEQAKELAKHCETHVGFYKVGLHRYSFCLTASQLQIISPINQMSCRLARA